MKNSMTTMNCEMEEYPYLLKETAKPPSPLFVRGNVGCLQSKQLIAVVGTRTMSAYGKRVIYDLIPPLVKAGVTIVSGLAYGVDTFVHEVALEHGGTCIAVLASGVDEITPRGNHQVGMRVLEQGGALLSEHPAGTMPQKHFFPARNRIISGLASATLVIEAGERSGALITARFALEQNRDVYAVPGSLYADMSKGTNALIAQGAYPVLSAENLLEHLGLSVSASQQQALPLEIQKPAEQQLYEMLKEPLSLDELAENSAQSVSSVVQSISMMELNGLVKKLDPYRYVRV